MHITGLTLEIKLKRCQIGGRSLAKRVLKKWIPHKRLLVFSAIHNPARGDAIISVTKSFSKGSHDESQGGFQNFFAGEMFRNRRAQ